MVITAAFLLSPALAFANGQAKCDALPDHAMLKSALDAAVADETSGLNFQMWATLVNRDGVVCAVAFSGGDRGAQWPGSRAISAQKANTANSFSLDTLALSTANLFSAVQPGGFLYGLQHSNPVDTGVAYKGPSTAYGQNNDPMVGKKIGGVNVFGGGLGLYEMGMIVGGVGVSGDTSCADHMIGWRVRHNLMLDGFSGIEPTGGVSGDARWPDNIIYDIVAGVSASGFGHPECLNLGDQLSLPPVQL
ncbi:MAG: heme-binding protein [Proteobacteria bacterium]|nr:heme-binding protein [Pseudomonadota bacterium]